MTVNDDEGSPWGCLQKDKSFSAIKQNLHYLIYDLSTYGMQPGPTRGRLALLAALEKVSKRPF